jgi:hypothetical protein
MTDMRPSENIVENPTPAAAVVPSGQAPIQLAAIALELGEPVEAIERALGAERVFRYGNFRCTSAFAASEVIAEYGRRKAQAAAEAAKRSAEALARHEETRAAALAEKQNTEARVVKFDLQTRPIPGYMDAGISPVVQMTAQAGAADYEGATATPRPSRLDWLTGRGEGGGSLGPSPAAVLKAAAQRRAERKAKKGKGTS